MSELVTQLGVAAVIVIMILDKVLPHLSKSQSKGPENTIAGDKAVDYWENTIRQIIAQEIASKAYLIGQINKTLERIERNQSDLRRILEDIRDRRRGSG